MPYGPFGNLFPYSDQHALNLDWIIQVAKDFLDQYTHIQDIISNGEESLDQHTTDGLAALAAEKDRLEGLLNAWYITHSEDIAGELASAISSFQASAAQIGANVLESIPEDYSALSADVTVKSYIYGNNQGSMNRARVAEWQLGHYYSTPAVGNTANLTLNDNANRMCCVMDMEAGEQLNWSGRGGGANVNAAWCFLDSSNVVLAKASGDQLGECAVIAPENTAKVILNNYITYSDTPLHDQYAYITPFNIPVYNLNHRIKQYVSEWRVGYYSSGTYDSYNRAICTKNKMVAPYDCELAVIAPPGYYVDIYEYSSDDSYIKHHGAISGTSKAKNSTNNIIHAAKGHKFHFAIGTFPSGEGPSFLTQDFLDTFQVYANMFDNSEQNYSIIPTGDTTDRTAEITAILGSRKKCYMAPGTYYVSGVVMPDGTMLEGCGKSTIIRLVDTTNTNLWTFGSQTFTKAVQCVFPNFLPAGRYKFKADVVSADTDGTKCAVVLYNSKTSFGTSTRVDRQLISRQEDAYVVFDAMEPFVTVELQASSSYDGSTGDEATFSNISLEGEYTAIRMGDSCTIRNLAVAGNAGTDIGPDDVPTQDNQRNGIGYYGQGDDTTQHQGIIDSCFIYGFEGGAIKLDNTGYSIRGLNISNCDMYYNYCGLYNTHFSEFHRITNCNMFINYIGALCNGGNNQFTACDMSSNQYGFMMNSENDMHNNGAHGGVTACIMQHNRVNAVYIKDENAGFVFTGCNIDNGGVYLDHAARIIFDGCNFMGAFSVEVNAGGFIMFNSCNMRSYTSSHTTITDNTRVKFINCYDNNGTIIDPTA